jgi:acyl transferase domain-containing protein
MATRHDLATVEPIAIISMQGRFPDAPGIDRFWKNLQEGVESLRPFTDEEVRAAGIDPAWTSLPGYVRAGTVLDDIELFDAQFFGISPRDAELIDPQQRLFLEAAWESIERAGYDPDTYPGTIAVFGGSEQSTYLYQLMKHADRLTYADPTVLHIGNDKDYLTTQVSYKLNLKGPSVAVQTACSTSLVAVTLGCQSLWSQQADMALAGGVSVDVPQRKGYWYQPGGIFSPDGHCRTFDASGQGTVVGNGVGVVLLKRLRDARADGDQVLALIKGAAINNDGAAKVGFSAPSVEGQTRAIRAALRMGDVDPATIEYVEAHGTATLLGDPIEVAALNEVFRSPSGRKGWCAIGSLKSNVGHLASAAGVAGLIKAVLCLRHRMLVPNVNFETANPQIDFANGAFYVSTACREWPASETPRRAGVSSFGVGGTNAHVVLEEAPEPEPPGPSRPYQLLLVSARTASALDRATARLADHLNEHPDSSLADVAYTTQVGRKAFTHRRMLVAETTDVPAAAAALGACDGSRVLSRTAGSHERPLVFMFSGQGSQYPGMGRDLYHYERDVRVHVDYCCDRLEPLLGLDLRPLLFPGAGEEDAAAARLSRTGVTQPALFTIEYALARTLLGWGITPKAMIGHSVGEYVAACLGGVFALDDALALIAARGRLMEEMPPGSMLAVPLSEDEARLLAHGDVSVAASNAPFMSVLSGPSDEIDRLAVQLTERGLHVRKLHTSHAFHSGMMDPVLERFEQIVRAVDRQAPTIPFISNVTGTWIGPDQARDPGYWSRHLRSTVQFGTGIQELLRVPDAMMIEIGPGHALQALARQQPALGQDHTILGSLRAPQEQTSDVAFLLSSIGQLWLNGCRVNWAAFSEGERRHRVALPTYPFERERYWIGPEDAAGAPRERGDIATWFERPTWKQAVVDRAADRSPAMAPWIVFADPLGLGEEVARQLRGRDTDVVTVYPGMEFGRLDDRTFTICPDKLTDYVALLDAVGEGRPTPGFVAHLWNVTGRAEAPGFDEAQRIGFDSLVCLARALERQRITSVVHVAFVSDQLQAVLGDEPLCPPKATAIGACKVLPQEYPNLRCRAVDVLIDPDLHADPVLADRIIGELTTEPFEPVVAYRGGRRWIQSFEPYPIARVEGPGRVRDGGVYVITGGLGNIGLVLAETLSRLASGVRIALLGRSAFPARDEWDDWLASETLDNSVTGRIRRLMGVEALGATVRVFSVDASDAEQMAATFDEIEAALGPVNGVIHGAGNTAADGFMPAGQVDRAAAERQFAPKARGLIVLEQIVRNKPLDFCVLLSSISAVLGGLNLLSYASANAFLDVFAARARQIGAVPWTSVNWDAWQFPADEAAYKSATPNWTDYILPSEGADAFTRVLDRAPVQVVVSTTNLQDRVKKWIRLESVHQPASARPAASSMHARPNLSSQFVAPRTTTERIVAEAWERLLGVAPIGIHDRFFELGGHSLLAIQLISTMREAFHVELPPQRLFEAPTIAEFAASIEADLRASQEHTARQDEQRMSELLDMVEGLSEEQVAEMLSNPGQMEEQAHG